VIKALSCPNFANTHRHLLPESDVKPTPQMEGLLGLGFALVVLTCVFPDML